MLNYQRVDVVSDQLLCVHFDVSLLHYVVYQIQNRDSWEDPHLWFNLSRDDPYHRWGHMVKYVKQQIVLVCKWRCIII